MPGIELETDKIRISGCWESLRRVTSLKEWIKEKLCRFQKHYSLGECNGALPLWMRRLGSAWEGLSYRRGARKPLVLTVKEFVLTCGSRVRIIICQTLFQECGTGITFRTKCLWKWMKNFKKFSLSDLWYITCSHWVSISSFKNTREVYWNNHQKRDHLK